MSVLAFLSVTGVRAQGTTTPAVDSVAASSATEVASSNSTSEASSVAPTTTSSSVSEISGVATSSYPTTASSNYTIPSGASSATFPANFSYATSTPYQMNAVNVLTLASELPVPVYYSLTNESAGTRSSICAQQTAFCAKAGCAASGATVKENFCNLETMASRCSCSTGDSNLAYYHWPVAVADCLNRALACSMACASPQVSVAEKSDCQSGCNTMLRSTCGTPGQIAADYETKSASDTPSLTYVQGATAGAAKLGVGAGVGLAGLVFVAGVLLTL
ncbi:hypothetical protein BCV69DRAFT_313478 [Microstroma glucosiphilum]|uniref:DUF7707 domain-containing protein n=1 Tax=Pseudomicrostroma glucosiphilum TaxID=1684307 RepID=A0A316U5K0_9BASI|nr:hypothetical protein BCV69DRAFT_313478 [Pseudomicrostroma glucosiphilum]PWN19731.1 hypothetical protein BCV69DRAFT_313478 [Pseudomicrostroma glucosiphilum]